MVKSSKQTLEWELHTIRGSIRATEKLCDLIKEGGYGFFISGRRKFVLRKAELLKDMRISYDFSTPFETYLNAIINKQPLPTPTPSLKTLSKLCLQLKTIGCSFSEIPKHKAFDEEWFELADLTKAKTASYYPNALDNVFESLDRLIRIAEIKKNSIGVIKGTLMAYQIINRKESQNQFIRFVRNNSSLSWIIVIQKYSSEYAEPLSKVLDFNLDLYRDIDEKISKIAKNLNNKNKNSKDIGRIYICRESNILKKGKQGVFYQEWCSVLDASESIDYRYYQGMNLSKQEYLPPVEQDDLFSLIKSIK